MKKTLVAVFAMFTMTSAGVLAAEEMSLPEGADGLYLVKGEVVDAGMEIPKCPRGAICEPASFVRVKLVLNGCADQLGPVSYHADWQGSRLNVYLTAYAFSDPRSKTARCFRMPSETITLPIGLGFMDKDDVSLHNTHYFIDPGLDR